MAFPSRGLAGFSRASGSLMFLAITRQVLIAAPWGLKLGKELEQTFLMRACSSPHVRYRRNVVTVLLTHFQAPIEAFRGHSLVNRGGDTVIYPRWEELVSLASQRRFFSVYGMPRLVVFIFGPSGRKIRFSPFSLFRG